MRFVSRLLAIIAGLTGAAAALAHEGHGLSGSHWHAGDSALVLAAVLSAGTAIWLGRK